MNGDVTRESQARREFCRDSFFPPLDRKLGRKFRFFCCIMVNGVCGFAIVKALLFGCAGLERNEGDTSM